VAAICPLVSLRSSKNVAMALPRLPLLLLGDKLNKYISEIFLSFDSELLEQVMGRIILRPYHIKL
jgi:hypothetical protein